MQCFSLSRDLRLSEEERGVYSELSDIFERAACTPPYQLGRLVVELRSTEHSAGDAAKGAALAFIDDVIAEATGKATVRSSLLVG